MMQCGHTACPRCVELREAGKAVRCACGETQAMPEGGVAGLPRDYLALKHEAPSMECMTCGERATKSCSQCKGIHFCDADAIRHAEGRNHMMMDFAGEAAAEVVVTCPKDPGGSHSFNFFSFVLLFFACS